MERIETRINKVYYLDEFDNIQETIIYNYGKIKMVDAEKILFNEGIQFNSILKVLIEEVIIEIPGEELRKYKIIERG